MAFRATRAFPSGVFGPRERAPLARAALIWERDLTLGTGVRPGVGISRRFHGRVGERATQTARPVR